MITGVGCEYCFEGLQADGETPCPICETALKPTNETVTITVCSPLVRPGLTLRVAVSKKYAADAAKDLMTIARTINRGAA